MSVKHVRNFIILAEIRLKSRAWDYADIKYKLEGNVYLRYSGHNCFLLYGVPPLAIPFRLF